MLRIIFVVAVVLLVTTNGHWPKVNVEELQRKYREDLTDCVSQEEGVTYEYANLNMWQGSETPDDLGCVTKCMMLKLDYMNESGDIKQERYIPDDVIAASNDCMKKISAENDLCKKVLRYERECKPRIQEMMRKKYHEFKSKE